MNDYAANLLEGAVAMERSFGAASRSQECTRTRRGKIARLLALLQRASPVTPNKYGSAVELDKSKTNDAAILDDPVELVTGTVAGRPE